MKARPWVSNENSEHAHRALRAAESAARRAAAPLLAVRQQKHDLESAVAEVDQLVSSLDAARQEIGALEDEVRALRSNADRRRASDAMEQVIDRLVQEQPDHTAPELRDLAVSLADLEANRTVGLVVIVRDEGPDDAVADLMAEALSDPRRLVTVTDDAVQVDELVALAHLSSSSYDVTLACLRQVAPLLVSGGRIVLDAYESAPDCRRAVDEYFRDRPMDFRFEHHQRPHVVRR